MEQTQDLVFLSLYLGFPMQLIGIIYSLFRLRHKSVLSIITFVLLHYIISIVLTIIIWLKCSFHSDVMFSFIFIPSFVAECILVFIAFIINYIQQLKNHGESNSIDHYSKNNGNSD